MTLTSILTNTFGRTGPPVTIVGLGGEGVLRTHGRGEEATTVIEEAFTDGTTYFESARAYAGSEGYYGLVWPKHAGERTNLFQTSKSAMRDRKGALSHPVTLAVVGCSSIQEVRTLAHVGRNFTPMSPDNMRRMEELFTPHARKLAFYRGKF